MASNMDRIEAFDDRVTYVCGRAAWQGVAQRAGAWPSLVVRKPINWSWTACRIPDPHVQANVVVQLRERGIPGAISRLIQLLDSPHDVVRPRRPSRA